jgi:hypothetical protein
MLRITSLVLYCCWQRIYEILKPIIIIYVLFIFHVSIVYYHFIKYLGAIATHKHCISMDIIHR